MFGNTQVLYQSSRLYVRDVRLQGRHVDDAGVRLERPSPHRHRGDRCRRRRSQSHEQYEREESGGEFDLHEKMHVAAGCPLLEETHSIYASRREVPLGSTACLNP